MKRRICLAIALALSFLMTFGSPSMAEEIKVQITAPTSAPADVEVVKVPAGTNKADEPLQSINVRIQVERECDMQKNLVCDQFMVDSSKQPGQCGECYCGDHINNGRLRKVGGKNYCNTLPCTPD